MSPDKRRLKLPVFSLVLIFSRIYNLVYAKIRTTPRTTDLQRLMAYPDLRCLIANTMSAAGLPPIPDGTCINDIATNMADFMLSIAAELVPHSKRPRGAQGWWAFPGVDAEMNASWQQREEARRSLRAEPHNSNVEWL